MVEKKEANTLSELPGIAQWVIENANNRVIAIEGEMGAGKTTLIKEICRYLNIQDQVSSPTFSLVNEYYSPEEGSVYHFDFYRLNNEAEAMDMGLEDYLYSGYLCLIEWPEKIRNLLPDDIVRLVITATGNKRVFELKTTDQ